MHGCMEMVADDSACYIVQSVVDVLQLEKPFCNSHLLCNVFLHVFAIRTCRSRFHIVKFWDTCVHNPKVAGCMDQKRYEYTATIRITRHSDTRITSVPHPRPSPGMPASKYSRLPFNTERELKYSSRNF